MGLKKRIITHDYKGVTKRSVKILPNHQRVCKEELNVKSSELILPKTQIEINFVSLNLEYQTNFSKTKRWGGNNQTIP